MPETRIVMEGRLCQFVWASKCLITSVVVLRFLVPCHKYNKSWNFIQKKYDTAIRPELTLRIIYVTRYHGRLYCLQMFCARLSGALTSDFAQFGTRGKNAQREVGGWSGTIRLSEEVLNLYRLVSSLWLTVGLGYPAVVGIGSKFVELCAMMPLAIKRPTRHWIWRSVLTASQQEDVDHFEFQEYNMLHSKCVSQVFSFTIDARPKLESGFFQIDGGSPQLSKCSGGVQM